MAVPQAMVEFQVVVFGVSVEGVINLYLQCYGHFESVSFVSLFHAYFAMRFLDYVCHNGWQFLFYSKGWYFI